MDSELPDTQVNTTIFRSMQKGAEVEVSIVVHVISILDSEYIDDSICHRLTLRDLSGKRELTTLPVPDLDLILMAQEAQDHGRRLIATGVYLPPDKLGHGAEGRALRFQLRRLSPETRVCQLVDLLDPELAEADALIDRLGRTPGALSQHILDELHDILGVAHVDLSSRFRRCETLTLLQSVSCGQLPQTTNPRLSTLIVSDPGKGKKMLGLFAQALAVRFEFVQPTAVTPSGLTALVEHKRQHWTTEPGALIRANGGTVVIEDIHRLPKKDLNHYHGALMSVTEDGQVRLQKAASSTYEAKVALHMNGNRHSVIRALFLGNDPLSRIEDNGLSPDLFNRMDVVAHLDSAGTDSAAELAREMVMLDHFAEDPAFRAHTETRRRALRVLVARLRDRFSSVDTRGVKQAMRKVMDDAIALVREDTGQLTGPMQNMLRPDSLFLRMANTVRKLVGAAARLDGRGVAEERDVQQAWDMLRFKLEVVRWSCGQAARVVPLGRRESQVQRTQKARDRRWRLILKTWGGGDPVPAEVIAESFGCAVHLIEAELLEMGIQPKAGFYTLPSEFEWQTRRERGEPIVPARPPDDEDDTAEITDEQDELEQVVDELGEVPVQHQGIVTCFEHVEQERKQYTAEVLCKVAASPAEMPTRLLDQTIGLHNGFDREVTPAYDQMYVSWHAECLTSPNVMKRTRSALQILVRAELGGEFGGLVRQLQEHPELDLERKRLIKLTAMQLNPYAEHIPYFMEQTLLQVDRELWEAENRDGEAGAETIEYVHAEAGAIAQAAGMNSS